MSNKESAMAMLEWMRGLIEANPGAKLPATLTLAVMGTTLRWMTEAEAGSEEFTRTEAASQMIDALAMALQEDDAR